MPPPKPDDPRFKSMGWPQALVWIAGFLTIASIFHTCFGHR